MFLNQLGFQHLQSDLFLQSLMQLVLSSSLTSPFPKISCYIFLKASNQQPVPNLITAKMYRNKNFTLQTAKRAKKASTQMISYHNPKKTSQALLKYQGPD